MHFERNHNLIPEIDPEEYELQLLPRGKNDENPISLSFEDLKKMPQHTLVAWLSCAGNKRIYL
jgi:sulfane dehydrogenase subunit SoxC